MSKDYSTGYIRRLLEHYSELSEGKWPFSDHIPAKKNTFRAPFENAIVAKSDMDKAVDALGYLEKEVITRMSIGGCPVSEMELLFKRLDVEQIERHAIRDMAAYLNGECVFERWCKENRLSYHGTTFTPDYLPGEIEEYLKDICLKYCVLKDCPN